MYQQGVSRLWTVVEQAESTPEGGAVPVPPGGLPPAGRSAMARPTRDAPPHPGADAPRLGICCSGGGIRSAAFNLGALQALDEAGVLRRADHLSAVSGGAFIASAYAVASRHSDHELLARKPAFAPGTPEEAWVRNNCSYLTNGFVDTVRVVAIALVGLLANLVFFTTMLWTLARPLGWFYAWWQPSLRVPSACTPGLAADAAAAAGCYDSADPGGLAGWAWASAAIAAAGIVLALVVRMFQPRWPLRQTLRRVAALTLAAGVAVGLMSVVLPELIAFTRNVLGGRPPTAPVLPSTEVGSASDQGSANLGAIATVGGAATALALVVQIAVPLREVTMAGTRVVVRATRWTQRLSRGLRRLANLLLGALIGPVVLAAVALLILNGGAQSATPSGGELAVWAAMTVLTLVMLWFADVTSWSMHPLYKWRLSRTFAVIRVPDGSPDGKAALLPYEKPLRLSEFAPEQFPGSAPGKPAFPELLVCAAVNVSDPGTTPPGRSSLSFVFGPRRIGHPGRVVVAKAAPWWRRLFYPAQTELETESYGPLDVDTRDYEARVGKRRIRDVTLSAAVAMSGAAVAPAMGKATRAPLRFLLALANVRLGVWLPNPANMPNEWPHADGAGPPANPRQVRLLYEVMGRHRVRSKFLYVTDGGHIENLGLLELLRRRCTTIVCLDAAGGSTTRFSTLGEAIALASSELNVTIEINPTLMAAQSEGVNVTDHVTGTIRYDDGTTGTLIYGKALVTSGSPWDVRAYAAKDPTFPVHPTADQLFNGETFDAYRALGRCVGRACAAEVDLTDGDVPAGPRPGATLQVQVAARPGAHTRALDIAAAASELG
jgi:hypothetical protein